MFLFKTIIHRASQWLIVLALLPILAAASSQTAAETAQPEPILRPFTQFTLDIGLTVLVREDHKLPLASVTVI